jgi:hypothetical protein
LHTTGLVNQLNRQPLEISESLWLIFVRIFREDPRIRAWFRRNKPHSRTDIHSTTR